MFVNVSAKLVQIVQKPWLSDAFVFQGCKGVLVFFHGVLIGLAIGSISLRVGFGVLALFFADHSSRVHSPRGQLAQLASGLGRSFPSGWSGSSRFAVTRERVCKF